MKRILILESNETFANDLSDYFKQNGFEVCGITDDGQEGLKLLDKCSPSVVVMSLLLKTIDGFTVMEEARNAGKKPDFIVLGNFSDDKIINRVILLGARYYLMKPVSAQIVGERVSEIADPEVRPARKNTNANAPVRLTSGSAIYLSRSVFRRTSKVITICAKGSKWRSAILTSSITLLRGYIPSSAKSFRQRQARWNVRSAMRSKWRGTAAGWTRLMRFSALGYISERKSPRTANLLRWSPIN